MEGSKTMVMLGRMHGDRWSSFGEHAGIRTISSLLGPNELRKHWVFEEFNDKFLREIGPDVSLATWNAGAVIFEEGTYLDLAFVVVEGEVEVFVAQHDSAHQPIFTARLDPTAVQPAAEGGPPPTESFPRPRTADGQTIAFLSSLDFDLVHGEKMRLGPGEVFGEIGALNGWPQSATARTTRPTTVLQIRLPALRKLRRKSKRLKERLDEVYRSRMLRQHLAVTPLLHDCPPQVIDEIAQRVELVSASAGDVLAREGEATEHLILVRSGFLKLSQTLEAGELVVSYVGKGSTLGEGELLLEHMDRW